MLIGLVGRHQRFEETQCLNTRLFNQKNGGGNKQYEGQEERNKGRRKDTEKNKEGKKDMTKTNIDSLKVVELCCTL